jgi:DNA-binding IclR family transcriptional regulator
MLKNVTVSLPDEVYRKARIKAAERNTSLSSIVKEFLESLADEEGEFKRLERLQEESYGKIECFEATHRVTREELHRRGNFY